MKPKLFRGRNLYYGGSVVQNEAIQGSSRRSIDQKMEVYDAKNDIESREI